MAGLHQIWRMRLPAAGIGVYAGNGVEDIVDGPIEPRRPFQPGFAAFAQPSGLATDGQWLYVADSEGSSIRAVPLDAEEGRADHRRHGRPALRPALHLRRRGRPRRRASGCSIRWAGVPRREALRGRHVQQQDQGDRPGHRRDADPRRQRRGRPNRRPARVQRAGRACPPPPASSTWPTPTTISSACSTWPTTPAYRPCRSRSGQTLKFTFQSAIPWP